MNEFQDIDFLSYNLLKGIDEYGFKYLSNIQKSTLKDIYIGSDIVAQAPSGTGKTSAFSIGALSIIEENYNKIQCIIVTNTHILAKQILYVLKQLSKYMNISIDLCIGGDGFINWNIFEKNDIIVATPGKLVSLLKKRNKKIENLKILIFDEADILFSDDFKNTIELIFKNIFEIDQVCLFSATYSDLSLEIIKKCVKSPKNIYLKNEELTIDLIKQYKILIPTENDKYDTLIDIYQNLRITACIIFVNSRNKADILYNNLINDGHTVDILHKDIENKYEILKNFRLGDIKILITTDILARGIDIEHVDVVINYDLPYDNYQYIHRIGRTGRYNKKGISINFTLYTQENSIKQIENDFNTTIVDMPSFDILNEILFQF